MIIGGRQLTYNSAQQLILADAIVGPDIEFGYDSAGRRTSSGPVAGTATTYEYDAAGFIASVVTPSTTVAYTTDARGLRQSRTEAAATEDWLWSTVGGLPLLLDDGDHSYIYGPSSTPIAQIDSAGAVEYLHTDLLGSVRLITDQDGDPVAAATFDEFGNRADHTGPADSTFGFTGAWTDADTGLVHLRARDYDPATGQFLTVDPLVDQTRQPYAYTGNNPLTRTDPTGLDFWDDAARNGLAFWAGGADGVGFNFPMLWDCTSYNKYSNNGFYWAGDVVGVLLAVVTFTVAADLRIGTAYLSRTSPTSATPVIQAASSNGYTQALAGGPNSGMIANYASRPTAQLLSGAASLQKQIALHQAKIANPAAFIDGWDSLDSRKQEALLYKTWPGDIRRQQAQLDILNAMIESRKP